MFVNKILETNKKLVETSFELHQAGKIIPDSYVVDLDTLIENAKVILSAAKEQQVDMYFMMKQLGRNPLISKKLIDLGYKGAVVVDYKEAQIMMRHNIPICNVGHLVQAPKSMIQNLVDYGCEYFTVCSLEKIELINECAKKSNKIQKLLIKFIGKNSVIYSGQEAGFEIEEIEKMIEFIKKLHNVTISGVTAFPCFLYDEHLEKIHATSNLDVLLQAKRILREKGMIIENLNAPSATSVATINYMGKYGINSAEPGHGLTGTTPLHAKKCCEEIPCVTYVSEISHNFRKKSYCYGGGYYRRSHMENALVGKTIENSEKVKVKAPSIDSIDYYFEIDKEMPVHDTVVMAFRFQIFVTRSDVVLVEGIQRGNPTIVGVYSSLGEKKFYG